MIFLFIIPLVISCKKDKTEDPVIAEFTSTQSATDFKTFNFKSTSQNYASLSWNFGDNTALSSEANPVHTFAAVGNYSVKLTATSPEGATSAVTHVIVVADPNAELTKLVGDVSKTWKLLRVTTTGQYPIEVGPEDHSTIWWAMGKDNDELAKRPCMLNDEWTFFRDGTLQFDAKGDYWAEGGVFMPENICNTTDNMLGPNGEDLSAWGSGMHTFVYTAGSAPTLKSVGLGAYVGFFKLGNGTETKVPLESVTYNVIKLTDGPVDTLIVEGIYQNGPTAARGYWRFVLMHYDNPADEPPIPGNKPNASFTTSVSGTTVTFTNTTLDATSYLWDFGDGATSTEMSPVHTYAGGPYVVTLSATNSNGTATASTVLFISTAEISDVILKGAAWRVRAEEKSVFVGPGLGKSDWWAVPKNFFIGGTGTDDWTCMPDDEFVFGVGNVFIYNTMGSARNDGFFGTPNGCMSDANIALSPGAPFGSATHSYVLTPASGTNRAVIELTNGVGFAAFLGFYKGFYGGENTDNTKPPNGGIAVNKYEVMGYANTGTKEFLFVSVDISATHDGSSAWSAILER
jgi:PKD repeat protein